MNDDATRRDGIEVHAGRVRAEWIDVNEHMNVAYYVLAFDLGVDALWARFGITDDYLREQRGSTFAVDCQVGYKRELTLGDPYVITAQILAYDEKRVHQLQRMYHAEHGFLAATCEWMNLHVDLDARRVTPWPKPVLDAIGAFAAAQGDKRRPADAGKRIRVGRPSWSVEDYDS
jgi:acyl-CoA thioester hydrolase